MSSLHVTIFDGPLLIFDFFGFHFVHAQICMYLRFYYEMPRQTALVITQTIWHDREYCEIDFIDLHLSVGRLCIKCQSHPINLCTRHQSKATWTMDISPIQLGFHFFWFRGIWINLYFIFKTVLSLLICSNRLSVPSLCTLEKRGFGSPSLLAYPTPNRIIFQVCSLSTSLS